MNDPAPNPITNTYNPTAWIPESGILAKTRTLVKNYITFPNPQNYPITFLGEIFRPDPISTYDDSLNLSTTAWVRNLINTYKDFFYITWGGIQTFASGFLVDTINLVSPGDPLTIGHGSPTNNIEIAAQNTRSVVLRLGDGATSTGGIHIGNGANSANNVQILNGAGSTGTITLGSATSTTILNCPLTPDYAYPVGTAIAPNTPSIGRAGTIGFIPATTWISNTAGDGGGAGLSLRSVSLTAGTWILYGHWRMPANSFMTQYGSLFSTALNASTNEIGRKSSSTIGNTTTNLVQAGTTMAITSLTTTTTYYYNVRSNTGNVTTDLSILIAIRIS